MICAGREFDDGSLSWDDLYAFIFAAPPGTAVFHAVEKGWTTTDYLLAHVVDGIHVNNWQRTEGARRKPPRGQPKPFPRPSDLEKSRREAVVGDTAAVGGRAATVITVEDYVARRTERQQRWRDKQKRKGGGS